MHWTAETRERAARIVAMYDEADLTFGQIAQLLKVSRQRVHEIYHREKGRVEREKLRANLDGGAFRNSL